MRGMKTDMQNQAEDENGAGRVNGSGIPDLQNYRQRQEWHHERTHQKTLAETPPSRGTRRRRLQLILRKGV